MNVLIAEVKQQAMDPNREIAALATVCLCLFGLLSFIRRMSRRSSQPDPWSEETDAELAREETPALCHRCLEPHQSMVDFCPNCGAPVGPYAAMFPLSCVYSMGHTLRLGTAGEFRHSPLTIAGFLLVGFSQPFLGILYPCVFLWKLLRGQSVGTGSNSASAHPEKESESPDI